MKKNVAMIESGIESPTITVARRSRRKSSRTIRAISPPAIAAPLRSATAAWMNRLWSNSTTVLISGGRLRFTWLRPAWNRSATRTALASPSAKT